MLVWHDWTWQVMKVQTDNGGSFTIRYAFASQRGYYPDGKSTTQAVNLPLLHYCTEDGESTILQYP